MGVAGAWEEKGACPSIGSMTRNRPPRASLKALCVRLAAGLWSTLGHDHPFKACRDWHKSYYGSHRLSIFHRYFLIHLGIVLTLSNAYDHCKFCFLYNIYIFYTSNISNIFYVIFLLFYEIRINPPSSIGCLRLVWVYPTERFTAFTLLLFYSSTPFLFYSSCPCSVSTATEKISTKSPWLFLWFYLYTFVWTKVFPI